MQTRTPTSFRFTIVLRDFVSFEDSQWTALEDGLHPAGCNDATVSSCGGVVYLDFDREAPTILEAVTSALVDVGKVATVGYVSFAAHAQNTAVAMKEIARDMTEILVDQSTTEDEKRMALTVIIDATLP